MQMLVQLSLMQTFTIWTLFSDDDSDDTDCGTCTQCVCIEGTGFGSDPKVIVNGNEGQVLESTSTRISARYPTNPVGSYTLEVIFEDVGAAGMSRLIRDCPKSCIVSYPKSIHPHIYSLSIHVIIVWFSFFNSIGDITYTLSVKEFQPKYGSFAGGTLITVYGICIFYIQIELFS